MAAEQEPIQCTACKKKFYEDGFKTNRLGRRLKTCLECNARDRVRHERFKNRHPNRCSRCSRCNEPYEPDPEGPIFNGRPLQTCESCRWVCEHGNRGSKECGHCTERVRARRNELRRLNICAHARRKDRCMLCSPVDALAAAVRGRSTQALKRDKKNHSLEFLGCNVAAFRSHIEAQFQDGMSWDNYGNGAGKWNIDHITPIKYPGAKGGPPTLEEVAARLHYTNTQPMWAAENIAKGNHFIGRVDKPPAREPTPEPVALTDAEIDEILEEAGF